MVYWYKNYASTSLTELDDRNPLGKTSHEKNRTFSNQMILNWTEEYKRFLSCYIPEAPWR